MRLRTTKVLLTEIRRCVISHSQYALKGQKLLAQGIALGNVGKIKVALKGQKL